MKEFFVCWKYSFNNHSYHHHPFINFCFFFIFGAFFPFPIFKSNNNNQEEEENHYHYQHQHHYYHRVSSMPFIIYLSSFKLFANFFSYFPLCVHHQWKFFLIIIRIFSILIPSLSLHTIFFFHNFHHLIFINFFQLIHHFSSNNRFFSNSAKQQQLKKKKASEIPNIKKNRN